MGAVKPKEYIVSEPIHPGETLQEVIEARGITQKELSVRMSRPIPAINEIIMGKKEITAETALALEHVLGMPANFWLNLQTNYKEALARLNAEKELAAQAKLVSKYPYAEMEKFSWVKKTRNPKERVQELLSYLGVSNLNSVKEQYHVAYRKSSKYDINQEKLAVWLRHGEIMKQEMELAEVDLTRPKEFMSGLRELTLLDIGEAVDELISRCAKRGIALVLTREFKTFPVSGATRWVGGHPLVQVSLRYKSDDQFWFSVFHELGHVFLHSKKDLFIEKKSDAEPKEEKEAN